MVIISLKSEEKEEIVDFENYNMLLKNKVDVGQ
ncbi:hypothetical protein CLV42_106375 [Chitinophaga ginsengisoli]|uniref:Uncharacterized protein n=1 Tax=Chitinophaga ginsengisoli TaxID=363837 RepID=A0A2P8G7V2_9BACT|nr:hypothetical protein CLV42_106375 [Chitinophaga ginsengisoli]